jgi:hypothetical protein
MPVPPVAATSITLHFTLNSSQSMRCMVGDLVVCVSLLIPNKVECL